MDDLGWDGELARAEEEIGVCRRSCYLSACSV